MRLFVRRCSTHSFSKKHIWISNSNGISTLGVTSHIRGMATEDVIFSRPFVGTEIRRGEALFRCFSDWMPDRKIRPELAPKMSFTRTMPSPISGRIVEVNPVENKLPPSWRTWLVRMEPLPLPASEEPVTPHIPPLPPLELTLPQPFCVPVALPRNSRGPPTVKSGTPVPVEKEGEEEEWLTAEQYKEYCASLQEQPLFTPEMWDYYMKHWANLYMRQKNRLYHVSLRQLRRQQNPPPKRERKRA